MGPKRRKAAAGAAENSPKTPVRRGTRRTRGIAPEEPTPEEPAAEEVAAEEPVTDEPAAEEPKAGEPAAEEPTAEEPTAEEPIAEEPIAEEPTADEPAVEERKADEPATEEEAADEPAAEEPGAEEPATEDPAAKILKTEEPAAKADEESDIGILNEESDDTPALGEASEETTDNNNDEVDEIAVEDIEESSESGLNDESDNTPVPVEFSEDAIDNDKDKVDEIAVEIIEDDDVLKNPVIIDEEVEDAKEKEDNISEQITSVAEANESNGSLPVVDLAEDNVSEHVISEAVIKQCNESENINPMETLTGETRAATNLQTTTEGDNVSEVNVVNNVMSDGVSTSAPGETVLNTDSATLPAEGQQMDTEASSIEVDDISILNDDEDANNQPEDEVMEVVDVEAEVVNRMEGSNVICDESPEPDNKSEDKKGKDDMILVNSTSSDRSDSQTNQSKGNSDGKPLEATSDQNMSNEAVAPESAAAAARESLLCSLCGELCKRGVSLACCGIQACRACATKSITSRHKCWNEKCLKPISSKDMVNDEVLRRAIASLSSGDNVSAEDMAAIKSRLAKSSGAANTPAASTLTAASKSQSTTKIDLRSIRTVDPDGNKGQSKVTSTSKVNAGPEVKEGRKEIKKAMSTKESGSSSEKAPMKASNNNQKLQEVQENSKIGDKPDANAEDDEDILDIIEIEVIEKKVDNPKTNVEVKKSPIVPEKSDKPTAHAVKAKESQVVHDAKTNDKPDCQTSTESNSIKVSVKEEPAIPDLLSCHVCKKLCEGGVSVECCGTQACRSCATKKVLTKHKCWNLNCATSLNTKDISKNSELRRAVTEFKEKAQVSQEDLNQIKSRLSLLNEMIKNDEDEWTSLENAAPVEEAFNMLSCWICTGFCKRGVSVPCCGTQACRICATKWVTTTRKCWNEECEKPTTTSDLINDEQLRKAVGLMTDRGQISVEDLAPIKARLCASSTKSSESVPEEQSSTTAEKRPLDAVLIDQVDDEAPSAKRSAPSTETPPSEKATPSTTAPSTETTPPSEKETPSTSASGSNTAAGGATRFYSFAKSGPKTPAAAPTVPVTKAGTSATGSVVGSASAPVKASTTTAAASAQASGAAVAPVKETQPTKAPTPLMKAPMPLMNDPTPFTREMDSQNVIEIGGSETPEFTCINKTPNAPIPTTRMSLRSDLLTNPIGYLANIMQSSNRPLPIYKAEQIGPETNSVTITVYTGLTVEAQSSKMKLAKTAAAQYIINLIYGIKKDTTTGWIQPVKLRAQPPSALARAKGFSRLFHLFVDLQIFNLPTIVKLIGVPKGLEYVTINLQGIKGTTKQLVRPPIVPLEQPLKVYRYKEGTCFGFLHVGTGVQLSGGNKMFPRTFETAQNKIIWKAAGYPVDSRNIPNKVEVDMKIVGFRTVPITTHGQMLGKLIEDPESRKHTIFLRENNLIVVQVKLTAVHDPKFQFLPTDILYFPQEATIPFNGKNLDIVTKMFGVSTDLVKYPNTAQVLIRCMDMLKIKTNTTCPLPQARMLIQNDEESVGAIMMYSKTISKGFSKVLGYDKRKKQGKHKFNDFKIFFGPKKGGSSNETQEEWEDAEDVMSFEGGDELTWESLGVIQKVNTAPKAAAAPKPNKSAVVVPEKSVDKFPFCSATEGHGEKRPAFTLRDITVYSGVDNWILVQLKGLTNAQASACGTNRVLITFNDDSIMELMVKRHMYLENSNMLIRIPPNKLDKEMSKNDEKKESLCLPIYWLRGTAHTLVPLELPEFTLGLANKFVVSSVSTGASICDFQLLGSHAQNRKSLVDPNPIPVRVQVCVDETVTLEEKPTKIKVYLKVTSGLAHGKERVVNQLFTIKVGFDDTIEILTVVFKPNDSTSFTRSVSNNDIKSRIIVRYKKQGKTALYKGQVLAEAASWQDQISSKQLMPNGIPNGFDTCSLKFEPVARLQPVPSLPEPPKTAAQDAEVKEIRPLPKPDPRMNYTHKTPNTQSVLNKFFEDNGTFSSAQVSQYSSTSSQYDIPTHYNDSMSREGPYGSLQEMTNEYFNASSMGRYNAAPPMGGQYSAPPMQYDSRAPPMGNQYNAPPMHYDTLPPPIESQYSAPPMISQYDAYPPIGSQYGAPSSNQYSAPPIASQFNVQEPMGSQYSVPPPIVSGTGRAELPPKPATFAQTSEPERSNPRRFDRDDLYPEPPPTPPPMSAFERPPPPPMFASDRDSSRSTISDTRKESSSYSQSNYYRKGPKSDLQRPSSRNIFDGSDEKNDRSRDEMPQSSDSQTSRPKASAGSIRINIVSAKDKSAGVASGTSQAASGSSSSKHPKDDVPSERYHKYDIQDEARSEDDDIQIMDVVRRVTSPDESEDDGRRGNRIARDNRERSPERRRQRSETPPPPQNTQESKYERIKQALAKILAEERRQDTQQSFRAAHETGASSSSRSRNTAAATSNSWQSGQATLYDRARGRESSPRDRTTDSRFHKSRDVDYRGGGESPPRGRKRPASPDRRPSPRRTADERSYTRREDRDRSPDRSRGRIRDRSRDRTRDRSPDISHDMSYNRTPQTRGGQDPVMAAEMSRWRPEQRTSAAIRDMDRRPIPDPLRLRPAQTMQEAWLSSSQKTWFDHRTSMEPVAASSQEPARPSSSQKPWSDQRTPVEPAATAASIGRGNVEARPPVNRGKMNTVHCIDLDDYDNLGTISQRQVNDPPRNRGASNHLMNEMERFLQIIGSSDSSNRPDESRQGQAGPSRGSAWASARPQDNQGEPPSRSGTMSSTAFGRDGRAAAPPPSQSEVVAPPPPKLSKMNMQFPRYGMW